MAKRINTSRDIDIQVLEHLRNIEYALAELLQKAFGDEEKEG